ncbi:hypothetical protein SAY87_019843 [Trapa incisa]|uniref:Uncharacterized protein n=1 Tax=Trapa incisa TaxID=236973 RepID=A0AAN7K6A8_9MYRT|nr:hypothetical protein SAY87_019843 [Trapa incisa]
MRDAKYLRVAASNNNSESSIQEKGGEIYGASCGMSGHGSVPPPSTRKEGRKKGMQEGATLILPVKELRYGLSTHIPAPYRSSYHSFNDLDPSLSSALRSGGPQAMPLPRDGPITTMIRFSGTLPCVCPFLPTYKHDTAVGIVAGKKRQLGFGGSGSLTVLGVFHFLRITDERIWRWSSTRVRSGSARSPQLRHPNALRTREMRPPPPVPARLCPQQESEEVHTS